MSKGIEQITAMLSAPGTKKQMLRDCVLSAQFKKRDKVTEITFGTTCASVVDAVDARDKVGIILWVDRAEFDRIVKQGGNHA